MNDNGINKLRWFLYEEYISIFERTGSSNISLLRHEHLLKTVNEYNNNLVLKLTNYIFKLIYNIFKLFNFYQKKQNVIFMGNLYKYNSILDTTASSKNLTILGTNSIKNRKFLKDIFKRKFLFYPWYDFYFYLCRGILEKNEDLMEYSLKKLEEIIKKINPDLIVLPNDALPDSRAVIIVAKRMGIPTVEIQHGIYQPNKIIPTGRYVDYVFVWGDYFKKLYLTKGIKKEENIKILGYPYEIKNVKSSKTKQNSGKKIVYYFGQNYEVYNPELFDLKISTIKELNLICNKIGFELIFRPHPGDDINLLKTEMPNVNFCSNTEKLGKSITNGDVFISFDSTALIEAALHLKVCIQLYNYPIKSDNFEELGICLSFDNLKDLEVYLKKISTFKDSNKSYKRMDKSYIEIPYPDPGTKFLELIGDLI